MLWEKILDAHRHKHEMSSLADLLAAYNLPIPARKQGELSQQSM